MVGRALTPYLPDEQDVPFLEQFGEVGSFQTAKFWQDWGFVALLPEQSLHAAANCLVFLGLGQEALRMSKTWRAVQDWVTGPFFDEFLMREAESNPDRYQELRERYGSFPSPEEFAASAQDRSHDEFQLAKHARQLAQQIRELHATFAGPVARIVIQGTNVLLDGQPVPLNMAEESRGAAICLLTHLLAAAGDWRSSTKLDEMEEAGPCKDHIEVRWDRVRKKLPPCLLDLTESDRRKGTRLLPNAWGK